MRLRAAISFVSQKREAALAGEGEEEEDKVSLLFFASVSTFYS